LKIISKSKYNPRWNDDSERGWILVADFLISAGKAEIAERELKKVLKYNRSSSKAFEYLGLIKEKNNELEDAA
jgi:predicted Zn-dependent protease